MKRNILEIGLILFCFVLASGCGGGGGGGGGGTDVPGGALTITNLLATAGNELVDLAWTESGDTGRVEITWSPAGDAVQTVEAGQGTYTASGLVLGTAYTFTVKSIDGDENITAELTATATPCLADAPEDAVYISTAAGLKAIDDNPAGYYVLIADIDISGENWSPLGTTATTRLEGTLDGNGHVITGLTISSSSGNQGFFDTINAGATVKNLGLEDVGITAPSSASGALASYNYGAISNCYSTGSVSGGNFSAGLVGSNYGGTISDSYSACDVQGTNLAGGLVGRNLDGGVITDCHATGTVAGTTAVGGLVGYVRDGSTISGCYAQGDVSATGSYVGGLVGQTIDSDTSDAFYSTISDSHATGNVSGTYRVGGLVGQNQYCDISDCYAEGNITNSGSYSGGLVGENTDSNITGCHASGTVSGTQCIGGLVGRNNDTSQTDAYESTISDSYSTAPGVSGTNFVGGLAGENANGIISFCHAEISGDVEGTRHVGGLVGHHDNSDDLATIDGILTHCFAKIGGRVNASDVNAGGLAGTIDRMPVAFCYAYAAGGVSADGTDGDGHYAGGLVGFVGYGTGAISNCYALSDVTGNRYLGGLVGYMYIGSIDQCYATGVVDDSGTDIGGLVGGHYTGPVTDSYCNSANTVSTYGTPVSLSDMMLQSTFAGWDFAGESVNGEEEIWSMDDSETDPVNSGYPYLTDLLPEQ